jgi:O-antigen biosynthesis protein
VSLVRQDYPHWEALVVNDGGVSVADMAMALDPAGRIRCIDHVSPLGPAAARNNALGVARGEVICYLDDDDVYHPQHLRTVVNALSDGDVEFVYTDYQTVLETISDKGRTVVDRRPPDRIIDDFSASALHVWNYIPINTWAHRRDCLLRAGQFDATLPSHEDWEFLIRMARAHKIRHVPRVTVEVRVRQHAVDSVTRREINNFVDVYRLIYKRHSDFIGDPRVRRARRQCLGGLAERERKSRRVDLRRWVFLFLLSAVGGALPVQRVLDRFLWWRFHALKARLSRLSRS